MGGYNQEESHKESQWSQRTDVLLENLPSLSGSTGTASVTDSFDEYAIRGLFYRVNYTYDGKYMFEANGRYDGTSRFPRGKRFGFFPSFSAAYRISEESFFEPLRSTIDNLKLRFSYGSLGNQQIGYYDFIQTISTKGTMNDYSFNGSALGQHATVSDPVSGNQTWEKVVSKNIGIDLNMLRNRLSLSADFYIRDTKGILSQGKSLPSIYGAKEPQVNANDLRTKGYELVLGWRDSFKLAGKQFSYGISASLSDYTAKYTKCDNPTGLIGDPYVGKRLGEIWGYKVGGLFRTDEEAAEYASRIDYRTVAPGYYSSTGEYGKGVRAGDVKYWDRNGDGNITDDDRIVTGNPNPKFSGGWNNTFKYKGLELSLFFTYSYGNDVYASWMIPGSKPGHTRSLLKAYADNRWTGPGTSDKYPRAIYSYSGWNGKNSTMYLTDGSFIRLRSVTLGYTFPQRLVSKIHLKGLRVYAQGDNVFLCSRYPGWDPETSVNLDPRFYGEDNDGVPQPRIFKLGVNITF